MNKKQQMRWNRATVQPFLEGANSGAERYARERLLSSLSRLPPSKRR
jgi:hypothetical protein